MTRFLDGPAKGQALALQRSPIFLRVVVTFISGEAKWDALDQIEDTPKYPGENVLRKTKDWQEWCKDEGRHL